MRNLVLRYVLQFLRDSRPVGSGEGVGAGRLQSLNNLLKLVDSVNEEGCDL